MSDVFEAVNQQHGSLEKANDLLKGLSSCMRVGVASGEVKGEAAFHDHEEFDREDKRMKQACIKQAYAGDCWSAAITTSPPKKDPGPKVGATF